MAFVKNLNVYQLYLFLGLYCLVFSAASDNLIVCGFERDLSPIIVALKDKYPEYLSLCRHLNPIQRWEREFVKSAKNGEKDTGEKRSALFEAPFQRGERYFPDRFSMFATRNPSVEGYKRGPGFRSWGGKRNLLAEDLEDLDKRTRFSSWGGKRSERVQRDDLPDKWWLRLCEGKETCEEAVRRDVENYNENHVNDKYGTKKSQFSS